MDNPNLTPEQVAIEDAALARVAEGNIKAQEQAGDIVPEVVIEAEPVVIPEKFQGKTEAELVEMYQNLEKKLGEKQEAIPPKEVEPPKDESVVPKEAEGVLAPEDFAQYNNEFTENGSLSEETYKTLEGQGLSKGMVDSYIAGQQALQNAAVAQIHNLVGGEAEYTNLVQFGVDNFTEAQKIDFNGKIMSNDPAVIKDAIEYVQYLRGKTEPQPVRRIQGESHSGNVNGIKVFSDRGEHNKAVSNRLYGRDAAYTNQVDNRYLASKKAGTI